MNGRKLAVFCAALVTAGLLSASAQAEALKFGYVDVDGVVQKTAEGRKAIEAWKGYREKKEEEAQKKLLPMKEQLEAKLMEFQKQMETMKPDAREKKQELLQKKYGAPAASGQGWGNELFKEDRGSWGTAVAYGHLKYRAEYEVPGMTITHVLNGDNFEISHAVRYASTRIGHLELQEMEREHLDGL